MYIEFPWAKNLEDIFLKLKTSESGLSLAEADNRLEVNGQNVFKTKEKNSALKIFLKQFASPLIFILIGAAVLTGVLNEWLNTAVIILAVLINVFLGFFREYNAENTISKLSSYIKQRAIVIRNGIEQEVDASSIVLGDIISLTYGSRVPADARIIEQASLRVDEAILTGESIPVEKEISSVSNTAIVSERKNMVHAGTLVVEGTATAVVTATSNDTEIGKIAGLVSGVEDTQTPLQKGLGKLSWMIFGIVIFIIIGIFILGISRGEPVLDMLLLSAAVSVGAVPEALPIVLTVILSIGAERIARKKGIVRTLTAAETLGSTTLIMTDKTGTLTEANMRLVNIYTFDEISSGNLFEFSKTNSLLEQKINVLQKAFKNIKVVIENTHKQQNEWTFKGRPIESHIAKAVQEYSPEYLEILTKNKIIIPFDSKYKFSVSYTEDENIVLGAPDILVARSNLSKDEYIKIEKFITDSSNKGERLVGLCTMPANFKIGIESVQNLTFIGIIAFRDPLRKDVKDSIQNIEKLGPRVVIITGDLKGTAISIANELGWQIKEDQVLTGSEIQALSDQDLKKVLPNIKIFARVTPEEKMRIGSLYQSLGEVVAMTGDGVNDSPALKSMDIGISLGSGSDVAKSASDIVLLDDNFKTIAVSITEGRKILSNIRKSFIYLMSNSLDEVFVVGGSLLVGVAVPLTALQIIWVNLVTGSLPALAFAYENEESYEKERFSKNIFSREVNIITFGIGVLSSVLLFLLYLLLIKIGIETSIARSVFFVCFSSYILVVAFCFKNLHKNIFEYNWFTNKKLNQGILVAFVVLILTMVIPFMRNLFGLAALPPKYLLVVFTWLVFNIALVEFAKVFLRRGYKKAI